MTIYEFLQYIKIINHEPCFYIQKGEKNLFSGIISNIPYGLLGEKIEQIRAVSGNYQIYVATKAKVNADVEEEG